MVESFPDGVFLHAGQPQAGKGLFAPGLLVDQSEDQFALPSGICQFAEVMERNGADYYPEIQTQDDAGAWELGGKGYIAIQSTDEGWDYTIYHSDYSVLDGGQVDAPELTIQEVREQILEARHMEKGRRLLQDYDVVMEKTAEAEELGLNQRHSTLEKLAALAGAKEKCDTPECSPAGCRKARDVHEL